MKKQILKLRIGLWLGLTLVASWFLVMKIVPSGHISYSTNLINDDFFISKLSPQERVENKNTVIGDPVYFSLFTPRKFDRAELDIRYRNNTEQVLIETGVLVDNKAWRYRLKPVQNKIVDELSLKWNKLEDNGLMLLQRENTYSSIDDFLTKLPDREKFALYNTDVNDEFLITDYQASEAKSVIENDLRGAHSFYTYIRDEDMDFDFIFEDLNQNRDSDGIDIHLYYGNQIIESWHLEDDGSSEDDGKMGTERGFNVNMVNLPEGVYKIELKANDDILTKRITTSQSKLSFVGGLRLANENDANIDLYTDGNELSVKTVNPDSLQSLFINEEELKIEETYKQFTAKINSEGISKIKIEKDGVILASDGVFSFNQAQMINPNFKRVDKNLNINNVDYILADYRGTEQQNNLQLAKVEIDLTGAYREDGKYSFIFSVPGLKIEDGESIEIEKIRVDLYGKSLFEKIKDMLK